MIATGGAAALAMIRRLCTIDRVQRELGPADPNARAEVILERAAVRRSDAGSRR